MGRSEPSPATTPPGPTPPGMPSSGGAPWALALVAAVLAGILLGIGLWGATGGASRRTTGGAATTAVADPPRADVVRRGPAAPLAVDQPARPAAATAAAVQPAVGQCLVLSVAEPPGPPEIVDCERPHHVEVVGLVEAPTRAAGPPSTAEWQQLLVGRCPDALRTRLATGYDPYGAVRLRISAPTPAEWAEGDRLGECLAAVGRSGDDRPALWTGPLRSVDQTPALPAGTCLVWDPVEGAPAQEVSCTTPHHLQVTGPLDLTGRFDRYPTTAQWDALDAGCAGAVPPGLTPPPGTRLVPVAVRIPMVSWQVGRRAGACAVAARDVRTGEAAVLAAPLTR